VLSERDHTRRATPPQRCSKVTRVADIMTRDVLVVSPDTDTRRCMTLMSNLKIRHLPVLEGHTVLGMISIHDIMDDMIADHETTIAQLEHYIQS
jgi:CBS domain-containing protein